MLWAGLVPRAEVGRAAAHLGALVALGSAQGFPHPGEFPVELCTQLCKTLPALQPKRQPWISPYRDPRISVTTGCQGVWVCCQPLVDPSSSRMRMYFLSSCFPRISEVWACDLAKFQNQSKFQGTSPASFTENPKHCSGFLGSQTAEEKIMLLEAIWVDDSTILPVSLCAFAHSLPFSQGCASTFLWNPCGLLEECSGSSRALAPCKHEYRGSQSTLGVLGLMKCLSPAFYPKNMTKEWTSERICLCRVITGWCRLNKHTYLISALLPGPLGGLSRCRSVRYSDGNSGKSFCERQYCDLTAKPVLRYSLNCSRHRDSLWLC